MSDLTVRHTQWSMALDTHAGVHVTKYVKLVNRAPYSSDTIAGAFFW